MSHTRQGSPRLNALREETVREWEATHDESGHPTTDYDASAASTAGADERCPAPQPPGLHGHEDSLV